MRSSDSSQAPTNEPSTKVTSSEGQGRDEDVVVFSILKHAACSECGAELLNGDLLRLENEKPLCLGCADLGHLVFLPRGDAALTRRSRKYSSLSVVVLKFSRSRRRYERQGLLVEAAALERAEAECLTDEEQRLLRRECAAATRDRADATFVARFAERIRSAYPGCPEAEAETIAKHACQRHSGRVGRSAAAKRLDAEALDLAVRAHIRHVHTRYDALLARGWERGRARAAVATEAEQVIEHWRAR